MIKTWSYSRYSTYKQCPRKAKYKYVDYIAEPSNQYLERGTQYHELAEKYIKGELPKLPKQLELLGSTFRAYSKGYKAGEVLCETEWGFTKDWKPCEYKGAWLKMKIDAAAVDKEYDDKAMTIIDWKTGKFSAERISGYREQLSLYALGAFIMHPEIEIIHPKIGFIDCGIVYPNTVDDDIFYIQSEIDALKSRWTAITTPMLTDTEFICNNSYHCKWCFYAENGMCDKGE